MYRVRIKKAPEGAGLAMGDQSGFGLYVAHAATGGFVPDSVPWMQSGGAVPDAPTDEGSLRKRLSPVDRSVANIEAERGETVWGDFDQDGMGEQLAVGGKPHYAGGTPLSVPEGSFVFSNTKRLKIGGPMLQEFGKSATGKKKYTPADLAKQYDVNRYKALLKRGGDLDKIERQSAALMLDNYQRKLGKLALLQEGMKGFPQGIPTIAAPLVASMLANAPQGLANAPQEGNPPAEEMALAPQVEEVDAQHEMQDGGMANFYKYDSSVPPARFPLPNVDLSIGKPDFSRLALSNVPDIKDKDKLPWWRQDMIDSSVLPKHFSPSWWPQDMIPLSPHRMQEGGMADFYKRYPEDVAYRKELPKAQDGKWLRRTAPDRTGNSLLRLPPGARPIRRPAPPGSEEPGFWERMYEMTLQEPVNFFRGLGNTVKDAVVGNFIPPQPPATGVHTSSAGSSGDPKTRPLYGDLAFDSQGRKVVYPGYVSDSGKGVAVPWVQQRRKDGTYGPEDWEMTDFYKRHPWVQQVRPDFDPSNPEDVGWFQGAYNDRYRDIWGKNYFDGQGHRKLDKKFGQGTYSTPSVVKSYGPPARLPVREVDLSTGKPDLSQLRLPDFNNAPEVEHAPEVKKENEPLPFTSSTREKMPWWLQDILNTGFAFGNRYNIKKYLPSYVAPNPVLPNGVYYDPTRALASNQEAMASQNMMNALYVGPQRLRSVGSQIQGQGAGNAANILGDYANRNVGIANQLEDMRAQILNNVSAQKAGALDNYLQRVATANQQYDNSARLASNDVRTNLLSGITNAQKTYWMNRVNPYFNIHPSSGALYFKGGKGIGARSAGSGGSDALAIFRDQFERYKNTVPNADDQQAYDFAKAVALRNAQKSGADDDESNAMMAWVNGYQQG